MARSALFFGGGPAGSHASPIEIDDFRAFLRDSRLFSLDIMLEIKDKEAGALRAVAVAADDERFVG